MPNVIEEFRSETLWTSVYGETQVIALSGEVVAKIIVQRGREWCAIRDQNGTVYDIYRDFKQPGIILLEHSGNIIATAGLHVSLPIRTIECDGRTYCLRPSPPKDDKIHKRFSLYEADDELGVFERPKWWSYQSVITLFTQLPRLTTFFSFGLAFLLWETRGGGSFWSYGLPRKRPPGF